MKKLLIVLSLFYCIHSFSQVPQAFNYQAVLRDASGHIVVNTDASMVISILQGSIDGSEVFTETHNVTTNEFGLVNLQIGSVNTSDFSDIDWSTGPYFLKITLDGVEMGTSQLLSVPFALHSKTSESISGTMTKHYVGELYGGGIVFWVTPDGQHGLIGSLDDHDEGNGVTWSNVQEDEIGAGAQSMTDGASNTDAIIAQDGHTNSAAKLCHDYTGGGFTDWYLPSTRELFQLVSQDVLIDYILDNDSNNNTNGFSQEWIEPLYGAYWSSTETGLFEANGFIFILGRFSGSAKSNKLRVRAIRAF